MLNSNSDQAFANKLKPTISENSQSIPIRLLSDIFLIHNSEDISPT